MDNVEKITEIIKGFPIEGYMCEAIALMLDRAGYGDTRAAIKAFVQDLKEKEQSVKAGGEWIAVVTDKDIDKICGLYGIEEESEEPEPFFYTDNDGKAWECHIESEDGDYAVIELSDGRQLRVNKEELTND